ncbi:MAG: hypothetical protein K8R54_14975 [Bacteroidales bacterium]|nr:hypothetical protein [Bacteroidales bacterium]
MEIAGFIIALIAILFALFTYRKHDLKLKEQASLLNKYKLKKIETEKEKEKKAVIEAKIIKENKGKRIIKVYNKGKSIAEDVNVLIPKIKGLYIIKNPCPIDIRPQNAIDIIINISTSVPDKIKIKFEWQDNFKDSNRDYQMIQL